MKLSEEELIKILKLYINSDGQCFATPAALASQILYAEEKAEKQASDITDRLMWDTD